MCFIENMVKFFPKVSINFLFFTIFPTKQQDFMLDFYMFTGFQNIGSVIELDRTSLDGNDTKH